MKNLTLEDYISLLSGSDMWHTARIEDFPQIMVCDGPHGLRKQLPESKSNNDSVKATCFPTASALACSFDESLARRVGSAIACEAYNENVSVLLGPGTNMKRSPLCGRNFEYYSEDPYLAGMMASSFIEGVEGEGIGTSLKHFAANNQETNRMTSSSVIDMRALREIYLRPFEYAVKRAHPASLMASYNKVNGVYSSENKWLLTDVLRKEWGFDGIVVSDWGASNDLTKSVKAGLNLEMPGGPDLHEKRLMKDYKKGLITEEEIKNGAEGVIRLIDKYKKKDESLKKDVSHNHDLAVEASLSSAVLLKNEGILPLKTKNVILIGSLAEDVRFQGGGSSHINTDAKNAIKALSDAGFVVSYRKGYSSKKDVTDEMLEDEALDIITKDDPVLFMGGLPEFAEGEGYDRTTYSMPENQMHLLKKIAEKNKNIIFVSFGGAPYDMEFENMASAILQMYLGGEGVMEAMALLLKGEVSPSGRLAESWPYKMEDTPSFETFGKKSLDVFYKESIFIGYRYYDSFEVPVRYPFGYGLSYTSFEYSDLSVVKEDKIVRVTFRVKNSGSMKAKASTLLFIENPSCNFIREKNSLKGFTKCELNPGEEKECEITLTEDSFAIYDKKKGWTVPSGDYVIRICGSINETYLSEMIHMEGVAYTHNEHELYPAYFDKKNKLKGITDIEFLNLYGMPFKKTEFIKGSYDGTTPLSVLAKSSLIAKLFLKIGVKEVKKMTGKPLDDPECVMMVSMIQDGTFDSVAMQSGGIVSLRLFEAVLLAANGHKMKSLWKLIRG